MYYIYYTRYKPNTPSTYRCLGGRPDKIASNGVCSDFEISSGGCHPHEWKLMA